jgi:hypothetical protein
MKILRYLALSLFSILIWVAATWYAVIDIDRFWPNSAYSGSYYLPFIAFGLGLFCLFVNMRLFRRAKALPEIDSKKSTSVSTGLLGYVLLITIAATVVAGALSTMQIADLFIK